MTQNERYYYDGKYNKILQKSCTNLKDLVKRKVEGNIHVGKIHVGKILMKRSSRSVLTLRTEITEQNFLMFSFEER